LSGAVSAGIPSSSVGANSSIFNCGSK
jgi:hypothetical protein